MKTTITFDIDTQGLDGYTDEYIAQLWHIAQANPERWCDKEAGELVRDIGKEIIKRWVTSIPVPLHNHAPESHYRAILQDHGKWIDEKWTPNLPDLVLSSAPCKGHSQSIGLTSKVEGGAA